MNNHEERTTVGPLFSIITPTYNSAKDIKSLATSIQSQTFRDFEWLVQDGESTDDTRSIALSSGVPELSLVSKTDSGISDAYNNAVQRSRGKYLIFLGADDQLASDDVLGRLARHLADLAEAPVAILASAMLGPVRRFSSSVGRKTLLINTVHHQGAVYSREIFEDFVYREDIPIMADYGLTLTLIGREARLSYSDIVITVCGVDGVSNRSNQLGNYWDMHRVRKEVIGSGASSLYFVLGMANVLRRKIMPARA